MANNQAKLQSERYPNLFSPIRIDSLTLANRATVSPMTRTSAHADGTATDQMLEYYRRYARGGFGLVITEDTYTDIAHAQGYFQQPGIATDALAAACQPVVDAVHAAGAAIVVQMMHAGAQGQHDDTPTVAPSAVRPYGKKTPIYHDSGPYDLPEALTETGTIDGFVASARRARRAGFDGVEIHGANGYLLDEFLNDYSNRRDDAYGGGTGNRVRMLRRVVESVREAVGRDFTVGIRLSQTKINDTDHRWGGPDMAAAIHTHPTLTETLGESSELFTGQPTHYG